MKQEIKYMLITVESYPFGWDVKYFYLPVMANFHIGDVITGKDGKRYRVIDGKTQMKKEDIDLEKYKLFE